MYIYVQMLLQILITLCTYTRIDLLSQEQRNKNQCVIFNDHNYSKCAHKTQIAIKRQGT